MTQIERYTNGASFNLASALSALATTLTPPSYSGLPTSGQFRLLIDREIILVTDASTHPYPLQRGVEGTTPASHVRNAAVYQQLTAGGLTNLLAAEEAGSLAATGQVLNFQSGATVTQVGDAIQVDIAAMTNPMTTPQDLIVGGTAGAPTRLAKGTDGQVLTVDPLTHDVAWDDPTFVSPITAQDDLIVGDSGGDAARLAKGSDGQVLTVDPSTHHVAWRDPTSDFSGEVTGLDFSALGLTGATNGARFVGGTSSGAPASGTFVEGDFVVAQDGTFWICTVAGSPGTWLQVHGAGGALAGLVDVSLSSLSDGDVLTWDAGSSRWINAASAGGPPSGSAGGDLSGTYPNPTVAAIGGFPLPSLAAPSNKFLKFDPGGGALELVGYGSTTDTVCQGADSRLSDHRKPTVHVNTHMPGDGVTLDGTTGLVDASDRIDWDGVIHAAGTHSGRPTADDTNQGCFYFETDTLTLFRSDGATWTQVAAEVGAGTGPPSGSAGGDLGGTYPNPDVDGLQQDALASKIANGFIKRNAGNSAWEEVPYGTAANTVCVGNDTRLTNARTPTGHHATHELGGSDMLEVETFILEDLAANIPAASNSGLTDNEGYLFWATDTQTLYRSNGTLWEQVAPAIGSSAPPSGSASGDLSGSYPSPEVIALLGDALPSTASNGFLKRNALNTAWELVAYGSSTDTVCQGSDSRLSNARAPTAHEATHLPAGSDAIDWTGRIHQADVIANLPTAVAGNAGCFFWATDTFVLYRSDGSSWTAITGAIGGSAPPSGSAGGDLSGTYPNPSVAKLAGETLPSFIANGFLKQNAANTALEAVAYGTASDTVCQGNDSRLSDSRAPSGAAGGDLQGTYPNPTLANRPNAAVSLYLAATCI